jgi:hypothetical protein
MSTANRRVKLSALAACISAVALFFLAGSARLNTVRGYATGPPGGVTGAPGELNCTLCHSGNPGLGEFRIVAPASYVPGQTYDITVQHTTTDTTRRRWGFELTVLSPENARAGTLATSNSLTQVLNNDGPDASRQYIEHSESGTFAGQRNGASWTFGWTAPATDVGTVTFYAAGNQANNNGLSDGDQIYTTTRTVTGPSGAVAPKIINASANKKHLFVMGEGFVEGTVLLINDVEQNTRLDEVTPSTLLLGVKVIKKGKIAPGETVMLKVRNPDGLTSEDFSFQRPN